MGDYLRDEGIRYLTISETELSTINEELQGIMQQTNQSGTPPDHRLSISYVLRYDGIGIVRREFEEIRNCFQRARKIERAVFSISTSQSYLNKGKQIDIRLDAQNPDNCLLSVSDDDEKWVDTTFRHLATRLENFRNRNGLLYTQATGLIIQLVGVLFGFLLCLIAANVLSPHFHFRYSFLLSFVALFLVFSNLWTHVLVLIGKFRGRFWPYVSFKSKPLGLLGQSIIAAVITLVVAGLAKIAWRILTSVGSMVHH